MKFGKVDQPEQVQFALPARPPQNAPLLDRYALPAGEPSQLYVGCTGWSMKEWVGQWYPAGAKAADYLSYYGRQFNTIELNTTHYRIPSVDTVRQWYEDTPADFRFCPKVPQSISHQSHLGLGTDGIRYFVESIAGLQEKLGCNFIQLPPYFGVDRLPLLARFLAAWPASLPLAVEVRHASWFATEAASNSFFELLEQHGATAVITDVAGRRDVLHLRLTAPRTMVRFVGNGLIPSDYQRIDDWLALLAEWRLPEVYFFPHEPDNILAPDMVYYMTTQAQEYPALAARQPERYTDTSPGVDGQMALF